LRKVCYVDRGLIEEGMLSKLGICSYLVIAISDDGVGRLGANYR